MWNPDIDRCLTQAYKIDGKSIKQCIEIIKTRYGVTFTNGAIAGRVHKLKIQKGKATDKRFARSKVTNLPIGEPAAPYKAKEIETPEPPLRKTLMQLKARECLWPVSKTAPHFFCGHRVTGDSKYCRAHHEAAYEGGPKDAKDLIRSAGYYQ